MGPRLEMAPPVVVAHHDLLPGQQAAHSPLKVPVAEHAQRAELEHIFLLAASR